MPTYIVHAPAGRLSDAQKRQIAKEVTRVHNQTTCAQTFFAQVMFVDIAPGNWFVGGGPLKDEQIFVHGQIRGGRSAEVKTQLITKLRDVVVDAAGSRGTQTWVYVVDLPPSQMIEYGHILPEPGTEAQWLTSLPACDRALMESTGSGN